MDLGKTAMERALELARSGEFDSTATIRRTIIREGYGDIPKLQSLLNALREAIRVSTGKSPSRR
jgi:hypothetical protein